MARPREKYWYALKVFYNRVDKLREDFKAARYDTFVPMTLASIYQRFKTFFKRINTIRVTNPLGF